MKEIITDRYYMNMIWWEWFYYDISTPFDEYCDLEYGLRQIGSFDVEITNQKKFLLAQIRFSK